MENIILIEKECKDSNHESIKEILDSIESYEPKKAAFLKIIDYFEKNEARLPVGYYVLFIEWLLKSGDVDTASDYIVRLNQLGIPKEKISELIFRHVIKPDESHYRERFNGNLEILKKNNVLISDHLFDFEHACRHIKTLRNYQAEFSTGTINEENSSILAVNIMDFKLIERILAKEHILYLVYHDLTKLYFMLMFEDFALLENYIETGNIVVFAEIGEEEFRGFFKNLMVITPKFTIAQNEMHEYYDAIINEIENERTSSYLSHIEELKTFYRDKDNKYYKEMFDKDPSHIKVLFITSEMTDLNKFIAKNWYETFIELGYDARLLIEKKTYERMLLFYITEQICHFKPYIVFHINHPVNSIFKYDQDVKDNILWIMRYRDKTHEEIYPGNTFFLPLHEAFSEDLKKRGITGSRILTTPDSVNFNIFRKICAVNNKYVCDITCVNNAGGAETVRLNNYLKEMHSELAKNVLSDIFHDLKEMFDDDHVFSPLDFKAYVNERMQKLGIDMPESGKDYIAAFAAMTMESLYRAKVIEWIIKSKITNSVNVWGKYWSNVEMFKNYHMGEAMHDEELASIYENSRIAISDVFWLHERNFEILASGGFPLVRYKELQEVLKDNKITNYFKENEEIVVFYSKDDLLNKIQYYLDNPDERDRIAENGRQVVIKNFSQLSIAGNVMQFIKNYYKS